MHLKRKLPVWLHADMETLQNRMFNYVFHGRVSTVDRHDIRDKWNKIKHDMEQGLDYMDEAVKICSSKNVATRKLDAIPELLERKEKFPIRTPKAC
jgi:hypothetical protein